MNKQDHKPNPATTQQPQISPHIPTDVWNLVLLRLPVKSLLHFRCVSKTWRDLIDSPDFVFTHTSVSNNETHIVRAVSGSLEVFDIHAMKLTTEFKCPLRPFVHRCQGYVDGIVLLANSCDRGKKTVLWNPSIGKYAFIPSCRDRKGQMYGDVVYGFGFDGCGMDFKVVGICFPEWWYKRTLNDYAHQDGDMITEFGRDDDYDVDYDHDDDDDDLLRYERGDGDSALAFAKVYSLKINTWKSVANQYVFPSVRFWGHQVFVSNTIHWIVCKGRRPDIENGGLARVISFDMETEIFTSFRMPVYDDQRRSPVMFLKLVAFRESLALLDWLPERCCLWVMEGHGASKTWTRKYSIGLVLTRVLHFKKNGELLFLNQEEEVKLYDIVNEQLRDVPQTCDGLKGFMGSYIESLVLGATKRRLNGWREFCVSIPEEKVQHNC